jgi:WD40 repeat protein
MSRVFRTIVTLLWLALIFSAVSAVTAAEPKGDDQIKPIPIIDIQRANQVDFEKEVLPILSHSCLACHNRSKAKAKLVLETPADILKGGDSGAAVVPGMGATSLLLKAAAHLADVDSPMPPPHNTVGAPDLNPEQLGLIRLWIDQGAKGEVYGATADLKWVALSPSVQPVYAVAVTPDGQFVACGRGNRIDLYHFASGRLVANLSDPALEASAPGAAHHDLVESLAFSPDGAVLASGSYREIKLWRRPTAEKKYEVAGVGTASQCVAASQDGKWLAVGDQDGKIRLWDAIKGAAVGELSGHEGAVTSLCFSARGDRLASVSADGTCHIWGIKRRTSVCKTESPCELRAVTWTEEDTRVAAAGTDGVIRLWSISDAADAEMSLAGELKGHQGPVNVLAGPASNEQEILSGGEDGTLRTWDVKTGRVVRLLNHGSAVTAVAIRKDGKHLASSGRDNVIRIWNADGAKPTAEIKGDPALLAGAERGERALVLASAEINYVNARISADQKDAAAQAERLAKAKAALAMSNRDVEGAQQALSAAKTARDALEVRIAANKRAAEAIAHAEEVVKSLGAADQVAQADDKAQIAAAANTLRTARDALSAMKPEVARNSADAALAKATDLLSKAMSAKAGADQEVTSAVQAAAVADTALSRDLADLKRAQSIRTEREAQEASKKKAYAQSAVPFRSLAFSPNGELLAAGREDGTVQTIDSDTGRTAEMIGSLNSPVCCAAFCDRGTLLTIGRHGGGCAWNLVSTWKLDRTLGSAQSSSPIVDRVTSLDFSPDGRILASGGGVPSRGGEIKLWDFHDGSQLRSFDQVHTDTVTCVRFSPDGSRLASASTDRFVRVTDRVAGKIILTLEGHQHHVLGVAWRANSHTLASAGADNTLRFWNADTGERKAVVSGFDKEVTSVCFLGDSELAAATSGDGMVRAYQESGTQARSFPWPGGFVYAAAVTPNGRTIVAGGENGAVRAWAVASGQIITDFNSGGPSKSGR